jgi:DDE superfamily endonuclease
MTKPVPCPPAPGPLEGYAVRFDDLFTRVAQRRGFREYLAGLLAPRDRNKTLTALAGAEPVTGAQHPAVQRLQFFLSESRWDPEQVNARRLELLLSDPALAPHGGGVLVVDDSGDRKDGSKTAHVGRQWREGGRAPPDRHKHRPGRGRCARSAPGFPPGSRCSAGGPHGPRRPRRRSCKP